MSKLFGIYTGFIVLYYLFFEHDDFDVKKLFCYTGINVIRYAWHLWLQDVNKDTLLNVYWSHLRNLTDEK